MSLELALNAVCDLLRAHVTQLPVVLGRPDAQPEPALCVWPWRMSESASARQFLPMTTRDTFRSTPSVPLNIQFMLLATPALAPAGLQALDAARRALAEHPVLNADTGALQVTSESLSMEELAGIFLSAHLPLGLCAAFALRSVAPNA